MDELKTFGEYAVVYGLLTASSIAVLGYSICNIIKTRSRGKKLEKLIDETKLCRRKRRLHLRDNPFA